MGSNHRSGVMPANKRRDIPHPLDRRGRRDRPFHQADIEGDYVPHMARKQIDRA
jgi:hypothetical protein